MTVSSCENLAPVFMVSIGIVALNEEVALPTLLEDVLKQDFPRNRMELLLADSGSTDQTRAIMDRFAAEHGEEFVGVKVLDNPDRIAAAGINVCLGVYTGNAFVRIDAHSTIPANFISSCVAVLEEGEQVAAGPRPTMAFPETNWTNTLLVAEESAFGSSVADYRFRAEKSYVDSAFHAMMRREVIEAVGLYDERLPRTEDNDYFYRIRMAGFRIRFNGRIFAAACARLAAPHGEAEVRQRLLGGAHAVHPAEMPEGVSLRAVRVRAGHSCAGRRGLCGIVDSVSRVRCGVSADLHRARRACRRAIAEALRCIRPRYSARFFTIHATYGVGTCAGIVRGLFDKLRGQ